MLWIVRVEIAHRQERAVGAADHARNVFFENAREIASLSDAVLVGALMLLVGEIESTTPDDDNHRDAEIGRRLRECAETQEHFGNSRFGDYGAHPSPLQSCKPQL